MAEHTPGPWSADPENVDHYMPFTVHAAAGVGGVIATVFYLPRPGPPRAEIEANARLLATAPALLAACRAARLHLRLPYPEEEPIERARVLADLETAIAAAGGPVTTA